MLRYTKTAIALHWLIALLIICGFTLGVTMVNIHGFTPTIIHAKRNISPGISGSAALCSDWLACVYYGGCGIRRRPTLTR